MRDDDITAVVNALWPSGGRWLEPFPKVSQVMGTGSLPAGRGIRSSEKVFWRKVLEIYATSIGPARKHAMLRE